MQATQHAACRSQTIPEECLAVVRDWTPKLARALKVVGLINIQYCVQDNQVCSPCIRLPPSKGPCMMQGLL